jgi:hypothetical protein
MARFLATILTLACLAAAAPAVAATQLFKDEAPLRITLTAPWPALVQGAKHSIAPYPATLTLTDAGGAAQSFAIQVRARGQSRRTMYCAFPPILLTFDKPAMEGSLFKGQKKLKLVTYCRPDADYEQRIMLEYLVYKLYNLVTPFSLRVRAAEVTYRTGPADAGTTRFGYLIEDENKLADRNGDDALTAASLQVTPAQLDATATTRAAMLEYMIGNLDWAFLASAPGETCCHNIRLMGAENATPATARAVTPIPYDFDSSGFVDAPYAQPPPGIPVEAVTERYFRGYCAMSAQVPAVAQEFLAHRAEMKAMVDGQPQLTPRFRDKADGYLDQFFAVLSDEGRLQREVIRHCR